MQRRDFIISLSSSIAAIAAGCRKPVHKIVPLILPDEINQTGETIYYNTVYPHFGIPYGITVKTREGKPVKIESNPLSPLNPNGTNATIQASIFSLYAPTRFGKAIVDGTQINLKTAIQAVKNKIAHSNNILILTTKVNSFLLENLKNEICDKNERVQFFGFPDSTETDIPIEFFKSLSTKDRKKYIISLGADILGSSKYSLLFQNHLFDANGNPNAEIIAAEPVLTQTGVLATVKETRRPDELEMLSALILQKISVRKAGYPVSFPVVPHDYAYLNQSKIIQTIEREKNADFYLFNGDYLSETTHAAVRLVNGFAPCSNRTKYNIELKRFESAISQNSLILFLDYNPYYSDAEISRIVETVPKQNKIILSMYHNETARNCNIHIPASNFLENWDLLTYPGDNRFYVEQPVVQKLNKNSISSIDFLLSVFDNIQNIPDEYAYLRKIVNRNEKTWRKVLQTGHFIPAKKKIDKPATQSNSFGKWDYEKIDNPKNGLYLIAVPSVYNYYELEPDNPFLLELPAPLTKLTWGNAALLNIGTAGKYDLQQGDIIKITADKSTIELPVLICDTCADDLIIVETGFGNSTNSDMERTGSNVFKLLNNRFSLFRDDITIEKTGKHTSPTIHNPTKHIKLPDTIENTDFEKLLILKNKKHHKQKPYPVFRKEFEYLDKKWEMEIDLSKCTGCSACVVACQIENNIPVVGKESILANRAMFWLNINSYIYEYKDELYAEFEPLMCQQCENAPCETVCPVGATTHSPEGINEMTYNRCVGSRYCMVNCPYEIRVFNYDDYTKNIQSPLELLLNPDVTVRSRGVSEKCTFCIQRINEYERNEQLGNNPEEIQTACMQVCPTNAINFGNILSEKFKITKKNYKLLENLNTLPSVGYISKFRNNDKNKNI
jgi:molybdopterin-containing oxidoreductase family iron-sulfur binding subunit